MSEQQEVMNTVPLVKTFNLLADFINCPTYSIRKEPPDTHLVTDDISLLVHLTLKNTL